MSEELEKEVPQAIEPKAEETQPMSYEDGVIKVDLSELNKPQEDAIPEQSSNASDDIVGQP